MKNLLLQWAVPAALLACASGAQAQESLAGVATAGAMGATLGAAGAGSISATDITKRLPNQSGMGMGTGEEGRSGMEGPDMSGTGMTGTAPAAPPKPAPALNWGGTGQSYINELLAKPRVVQPIPERVKRSPKAQANYSKRVSKLSAKQRAKLVESKYKIPAKNWLADYLPQDRYKLGTSWKFVSTESDRFYYTPQGMTSRKFNRNRVIGFNSFQDALIAGYRPDPSTKPAPGAGLAAIARLYRGPMLYQYAEYLYSGQVSPSDFDATYRYSMQINSTLREHKFAIQFIPTTIEKVLEASISGDASIIPTTFTAPPPPGAKATIVSGILPTSPIPGTGENGEMGSPMGSPTGSSTSTSSDPRAAEFNNFSNRAGSMANVPSNR